MRSKRDNQYPNGKGHYVGGRNNPNRKPKRRYPNRWAARKGLLRRLMLDWLEMGTYPCTGGDNTLHYHFGHSSARERWEGWKDLQRYRLRHNVLFRLYNLRRKARNLVKPGRGVRQS